MASEKRKYINYVSPAGVAIFPRVNKPDTKFNKAGVYSAKLKFKSDDAALLAFIAKYTETLDEFEVATKEKLAADKKTAKRAASLSRVEIGKPEMDDNDDETGYTVINFKLNASYTDEKSGKTTTYVPKLFDAKNKATTVSVWGGSILKIAGTVNPYYVAKDNEIGISFRMSGVQILKLVTGNGQSAERMGFTEEEGGFEDTDGSGFKDETPAQDVPADAKPAKGADF
jgi:hypothetical protein